MMTNALKQHVQNLHLSGLLNSLELRLQEAEANRLPYAQFLELLLQDEINVRDQRVLARRRKSADFREPRSLENFDFSFKASIALKFMNWPPLTLCVSRDVLGRPARCRNYAGDRTMPGDVAFSVERQAFWPGIFRWTGGGDK